ncbi:M16 family metallopeptidase [Mesorhizobium xinjiangense]|uniref:M16 family metallopeptidase n=1 Tax=Mesorhizobium xinjiangense TaxID=2678685 RepID=UPI0012EE2036|nr:pitrilysin family protein [Mesorhizobium xinjiangense]
MIASARPVHALLIAIMLALAGPGDLLADEAGTKAPAENAVASFELDNGLQVVVIPDHRAPVVTHMLWYKVGSADEQAGKSGIAHFFEHLMFKGTKNHPPGEFATRVAEIGGQENAFTSYDHTAYFQQVRPEALKTMMSYEADRMRNLVLTDEVIDVERNVVLEERRQRVESSPGALLGEELDATLYQNHPYRIPVIGWMHEIEALNRDDAVAFYNRFYVPNNAVLVVAGDVEAEQVRALAEATYGKIARGPDLSARLRPQEPEQNTRRTVTLSDDRVSRPSLRMAWVVPSYETGAPGEAEALDLLSEILGGGPRTRLYEELVVRQGVASSVGAYYQGDAVDDTSFELYGAPRGQAALEEVEDAIVAEIAKIAAEGVTEKELARAKRRYQRGYVFARDSQSGMARIYGTTLTTGGSIEDINEWPARIKAVSAEQVKQAAQALDQGRAVVGYLLPAQSQEDDAR